MSAAFAVVAVVIGVLTLLAIWGTLDRIAHAAGRIALALEQANGERRRALMFPDEPVR